MTEDITEFREYPVLYVDDEDANLIVFQAAFGDEFDVITAVSGHEALATLASQPVALVISDYRMPGMTGVELLARVRAEYPDVQRLLATAYSNPATAIAAINEAAVSRFIQKPFDDASVRQVLRDALRAVHHERTLQHLRLVMIERERMAGIAAARAKILHDLVNMSDVVDACCASLETLLADQPGLPPDVAAELRTLRAAVDYVVRLHARSRSSQGGHRPSLHEADDVMQQAAQLACTLGGRAIRVSVRECGLSLFADRIDVSRILLNLMTNAAHSLHEAGRSDGQIEISGHAVGDRTVLRVRDNGPGIPRALEQRIFELHFSTRSPDRGSGLGLSICRELARANGASLELVANDGEGACFELSLPGRPSRGVHRVGVH